MATRIQKYWGTSSGFRSRPTIMYRFVSVTVPT